MKTYKEILLNEYRELKGKIGMIETDDSQYDENQLKELVLGLRDGLNVSKYNNPVFEWKQMHEIRLGLESGIDVDKYNKPEFNHLQMNVISAGLREGINVDTYANPEIPYHDMIKARVKLLIKNH